MLYKYIFSLASENHVPLHMQDMVVLDTD